MRLSAVVIAIALAGSTSISFAASRLYLIERDINANTIDIGPKGDSVGDMLVWLNPIYDADNKVQLGTVEGVCIRVEVSKFYECTATFILKRGLITIQGRVADMDPSLSQIAMTGGTGEYLGAKGPVITKEHGPKRADGLATAYEIELDMK
jgi:Dirigent-like protein